RSSGGPQPPEFRGHSLLGGVVFRVDAVGRKAEGDVAHAVSLGALVTKRISCALSDGFPFRWLTAPMRTAGRMPPENAGPRRPMVIAWGYGSSSTWASDRDTNRASRRERRIRHCC